MNANQQPLRLFTQREINLHRIATRRYDYYYPDLAKFLRYANTLTGTPRPQNHYVIRALVFEIGMTYRRCNPQGLTPSVLARNLNHMDHTIMRLRDICGWPL